MFYSIIAKFTAGKYRVINYNFFDLRRLIIFNELINISYYTNDINQSYIAFPNSVMENEIKFISCISCSFPSKNYEIFLHNIIFADKIPTKYPKKNKEIIKSLSNPKMSQFYIDHPQFFDNIGKGKLNLWNGLFIVSDQIGSIVAYAKRTGEFYFGNEGMWNLSDEELSKPFYFKGFGDNYIILNYNDAINLFYNYFRSYEIYMDCFLLSDQERTDQNPEYPMFKKLIPLLEEIYFDLVEKGKIKPEIHPDLTSLGIENDKRPVRE